jgi:cation/acetate symporter
MTTTLGSFNPVAVAFFLVFIAVTLGITYWAAKKTTSTQDYYTAGGEISGFQNGLALAGDFMSAASFLGITGMVALKGFDGLIYSIGFLVGWPVVMFLVAEPLRNLGKYTFADVLAFRLQQTPVRIAASISSLAIISFYLIAQMVGAGSLIKLLFGMDYYLAILIVGGVMMVYVIFGGMIATTWVQIIKAVLLLGGATLMAVLVLSKFGFNPLNLFTAAVAKYPDQAILVTREKNAWDPVSLGLSLMLGTAGLPHILMRFYTVRDAKTARSSVMYATGLIGYFYLLTFILGFGSMVLVGQDAIKHVGKIGGPIDKSGNMAAPMLAELLGGNAFLGFIAAVSFATILAVVAGLTLSGAAALAHDIWGQVIRKGQSNETEQLKMARYSTLALGVLAVILGMVFEGQNVAYMVGLAFAIAASANFPALLLSMLWRGCSTKGAVASMMVGTVSALILIYFSPLIQVDILKHTEALFPLKNPGLVTIPLSFVVGIVVSILTPEADAAEKFIETEHRIAGDF